jgi:enoyl-CoA hydratase
MMTFKTVLYEVRDHVAEIRFNRPQRLNAVVQQLYDDLCAALRRAEEDRDVRAVLLTGEGRAFCVGADLKEHKAGMRSAFDRHRYLKCQSAPDWDPLLECAPWSGRGQAAGLTACWAC